MSKKVRLGTHFLFDLLYFVNQCLGTYYAITHTHTYYNVILTVRANQASPDEGCLKKHEEGAKETDDNGF